MAVELTQQQVVREAFQLFGDRLNQELTSEQVQATHAMIRMGGISLPQVKASMRYTCLGDEACEEWELMDLLREMDRRYFLIQDFRWEFSLLDTTETDTITEEQAMWFLQSVHGEHFSRQNWDRFIRSRPSPGSRVTFPEIEVELCNIPSYDDVMEAADEEQKKREALERIKQQEQDEHKRRKEKLEEEKQRLLEEQQSREEEEKLQEEKRRKEEEKERRRQEREEEERRRKSEQDQREKLRQEAEERRKREDEEAKNIELVAQRAAEEEAAAAKAAAEAKDKLKRAEDAKTKKELEEAEAEALRKQKESQEKKIRANLKVAIKVRKRKPLKKSTEEFKKAKLKDHDGDLAVAERLLKLGDAKSKLRKAMEGRQLKELEGAINHVRKNGFEPDLQSEMMEANDLLLRLKRLERIRAEILELKQSTVAEIRSYSSPPPIVHSVMIATFLILGHAESETREWKKVQALVGKTGKEGLKRRCLEYEPQTMVKNMDAGLKAKKKMADFELDEVRDVSAGAATFYLWAFNIIEEAEMIVSQQQQAAQRKNADDDDDI